MDGRAVVGVLWTVAVGVAVGATVELTCQNGCRCWTQDPHKEMEYRVICSGTPNQTLSLTEAVFGESRPEDEYKTYVRVDGPSTLLVTEEFLQRWRQYHSCVLDVWSVEDLRLPHVTTFLPAVPAPWEHVFAGVGLVDVSVDFIPSGLFSGKQSAGLRLTRSSVGRISSELLRHVGALKYLKVRQSSVGLFEGPLGPEELKVKNSKRPVYVEDSTLGRLGEGALRLTTLSRVDLVLQNTIVGEVSAEALDLSGPAKLVLDDCQVAHLDQLALTLHGEATLAITNSTVMAEPGALSGLPCSFHRNHIHSNRVFVLAQDEGQVHTPDLANQTLDLDQQPSIREVLETVLHPTCVEDNLPQELRLTPTGLPEPRTDPWPLRATLYSFIGVVVLVLMVGLVLACLLVRARRRHRPNNDLNNQVVVMSQLHDDPVYEEPSFLRTAPPPVPPPTVLLDSYTAKLDARPCAADATASSCCAGSPLVNKVVENEYMNMH